MEYYEQKFIYKMNYKSYSEAMLASDLVMNTSLAPHTGLEPQTEINGTNETVNGIK
ncbi:MAG TPA: hypothetical protein VF575_01135 [Candidatus Saccharimonadales bacterium]|jgi:hypothetical protein